MNDTDIIQAVLVAAVDYAIGAQRKRDGQLTVASKRTLDAILAQADDLTGGVQQKSLTDASLGRLNTFWHARTKDLGPAGLSEGVGSAGGDLVKPCACDDCQHGKKCGCASEKKDVASE